MTTTTQPDTKQEDLADRLLRLRDELIVRNHLASMEVKDAVKDLGHELERLAGRVKRVTGDAPDEAKRRMYLGYLDADLRLVALETALREALRGASESVKLKAALARMEARSAAEDQSKAFRHELHELEAKGKEALRNVEKRLREIF